MLKTLLKKQLMEIFRSYFYDAKKNKARSRLNTALLFALYTLLMVGVIGGMFGVMAYMLCGAMVAAGMDWLYFVIFTLIAVALGVFGSVFNTYSGLYLAKDNDLLLSMPIPVNAIMAARLGGVYLMGLMFSGMVLLPAVVVYLASVPITIGSVVGALLLIALVSIFVLVLSCAMGWVVAKISLKLKNRSFITVVVAVVFMAAYYVVYFKATEMIESLIVNVAVLGERVRAGAYPLYLVGRIGQGDWLAMLIMTGAVLALFALMWLVMSSSFVRIATATGNTARAVYREKAMRRRSAHSALLRKELKRFTSSPNYMLNCGFGIAFLLIAGAAMLLKGDWVRDLLPQMAFDEKQTHLCVAAMICLLGTMNDMAAPSVSLEGKSLWIVRSLPVAPWHVLRAKLELQLLLSGVPTLFCSLCALAAFRPSPAMGVFMLAAPAAFAALMACFDLTVNLLAPNLSWTNELMPIKQSLSVFVALFGGWGFIGLSVGAYALFGAALGAEGFAAAFTFTAALSALLLGLWLRRGGCRRFEAL